MRELNINTLIGDMFSGVPSVYATFVGYDKVAHHSGVESKDAFDILFKLDQQFARQECVRGDAAPLPVRYPFGPWAEQRCHVQTTFNGSLFLRR
jgi:hypothetical protein